jgi:hypothetical protein
MLTLDDGGVFTLTFVVGAANGVPVPVVVVVVVLVVVGVPPLVGALASDFLVSLEQALVTDGVPPELHVGHDPPVTVALPPSPPHPRKNPSTLTMRSRRTGHSVPCPCLRSC